MNYVMCDGEHFVKFHCRFGLFYWPYCGCVFFRRNMIISSDERQSRRYLCFYAMLPLSFTIHITPKSRCPALFFNISRRHIYIRKVVRIKVLKFLFTTLAWSHIWHKMSFIYKFPLNIFIRRTFCMNAQTCY